MIPNLERSYIGGSRCEALFVLNPALPYPKRGSNLTLYPEGHGDLVSGLMMGITRVTTWVIEVINLLT